MLLFPSPIGAIPKGPAVRLARHAMTRILRWTRHIVHEPGHVWCGAGHCQENTCFMDHSAHRLQCAVRARLGLYYYDEGDGGPWQRPGEGCLRRAAVSCSGTGDASEICRIGAGADSDVGVTGNSYFFCRTRCDASQVSPSFSSAACGDIHATHDGQWWACKRTHHLPGTAHLKPHVEYGELDSGEEVWS